MVRYGDRFTLISYVDSVRTLQEKHVRASMVGYVDRFTFFFLLLLLR
jgi:hypothetical protein